MPTPRFPHLLACLLLAAAMFAVGCQSAPTSVASPDWPTVHRDDYARTYAAAQAVLRDGGFILDRQDYRFGVLTTKPRTAPTAFEPWHHVHHTVDQTLASTLNYQRRVVRITLAPDVSEPESEGATDDPAAQGYEHYQLRVQVDIEQIELPGRRLSGSRRGGAIFNQPRVVPAELQARGIRGNYWLPVARDLPLQQRLLQDILRRAEDM